MFQVKRQMRSRRVAFSRFGLEATQHHFLQPLGQIVAQAAWRGRVHPQTLAHAALGLRVAKGQLGGGQFVQHDANGKDVAARVAAHADHLLGCNPSGRAHGLAHLFGQQIGVVRVAR